jgi:subtilisin family serine protease
MTRVRGNQLVVVLGMTTLGLLMPVATAGASAEESGGRAIAPLHRAAKAPVIPGRYIVVMDRPSTPSDRADAQRQAVGHGGRVSVEYEAALDGFAAELPERAVEALRRNPHVQYVETDIAIRAQGTQSGATWGLDRIDQRYRRLNRSYRYDRTGAGVTAYIIDSGIRRSHNQFGGRVAAGFTRIRDGRGTRDCNGHGTHVAGTVGAKRYGVAKRVTLRPVRVLNCRGYGRLSGVVAGIDWVTSHHTSSRPAVANLSLGSQASWTLDRAVNRSIRDGVTYVVAAGNDNRDACNYSPARVPSAVTVGATTKSDARSAFSNKGPCVDLFAPGSGITSTWSTSNTATKTISGTSMAAPHVAGAAALILQQQPTATPDMVTQALRQSATTGVVTNRGYRSPNRLLFSRAILQPPPSPATGNVLVNGGFEQGSTGWNATTDVITNDAGVPAHQGSWKAWLGGYGASHTDTLTQTVTIPAGANASLSFYLLIETEESPGTAYDRLTVDVVSNGMTTRLGTYSNLHASTSYARRTFDVTAFAGRTITLRLTATEDDSLATSFIADDLVLTAS